MTGQTLNMWFDNETHQHKLSMGNQTATILRPDVVLENGVLHIIDTVLLVPSGAEDQPLRTLSSVEPTAKATSSGGNATAKAGEPTGKPKAAAESGAVPGRGLSAQLTMMAVLVGAVLLLVE